MRGRRDRPSPGGLDNIARAFAHRNYRVYVIGNSISLIGWWLERVAVGWLTWTLTHSGAWLGLVSLADFLPVLFLAPFAGVLADRRDRVWTIRITQWIGCAQASVLAILVVYDVMTIEILFALVLMLGIANGVAQPSRLALIPTLVDRAVAGLGTGYQFSRVQPRAVYRSGAGRAGDRGNRNCRCFRRQRSQLHRLSDLAAEPARAAAATRSRAPERTARLGRGLLLCLPASRDRADAAAVRRDDDRHPRLYRAVSRLRRSGLWSRAAGSGDADLDGRARRDLRRQLDGPALGDHRPRPCRAGLHVMMSLAILAFTATDVFYLALPCVFVAGAMMTITGTGAQTLIQAAVDDRMSGRVMALYGMIFRAGPAVGAVLMGTLSEYLGLRLRVGAGCDCVGRLLAGDAVPSRTHGGRAGASDCRPGRRPMTAAEGWHRARSSCSVADSARRLLPDKRKALPLSGIEAGTSGTTVG